MVKKIKPLLPSLKEKKRYLAFRLISEDNISDFHKVEDSIIANALGFMGKFDFSKAGIQVIEDCYKENKGVIRINAKYIDEFKSSLLFLTKINGQEVIFQTVGLSGILKKAKDKYLAA